jgi:peptide chain release factor subunit 1
MPVHASADALKRLIPLARSPHFFLSAYLSPEPDDPTMNGLRLRLAARMNEIAQELADSPSERAFLEERAIVERFVSSLRPGGQSLMILSSQEAKTWDALWLPAPVHEHVRFGRGVYVLPLLEMLNEWEPVGLVEVRRDRGRIMVFSAGRLQEDRRFTAEVPGKHKVGGGTATHYRQSAMGPEMQHLAGGGAATRYQRHIEAHVEQHLIQVAQELGDMHQRTNFRRFFVTGPRETVAMFRPLLHHDLEARLGGALSFSPRATETEIFAQVIQRSREAERQEELGLVQELITRAEKGQGAVAGVVSTLGALDQRQVHRLVLAADMNQPGRYCHNCRVTLPVEAIFCPRCDRKTIKVNLWEELPGVALAQDVPIKVVHGEAASELWAYEGIGALLKPPATH